MGYKVGDEVLIKAKICNEILEGVYEARTKNAGSIAVSDEEIVDKTYEMGLSDAWNLAKKIVLGVSDGGIDANEVLEIFGCSMYNAMRNLSCEEALAKTEAYEKEKEIKVGDVVTTGECSCVITRIYNKTVDVMFADGVNGTVEVTKVKKTGKHIDIESLLRQIGE